MLIFILPLAALVVLWAAIVWAFDVNQRIFPSVPAVWNAALEALRDGTLIQHIGASLGRIAVGTVLAILVAVPLGIAMGVNKIVADFLNPLLRFFSVLAGYPVAYLISSLPQQKKGRLLFWVLLSFWSSFLVRAFAWIVLLGRNGVVNQLLLALGIVVLHLLGLWSLTQMPQMRRTVADGVSTCTGLAAPSSTGPMAMPPPAAVLSRL